MVTQWLYEYWAVITLTVGVGLVALQPRGWALLWLVVACFIDSMLHDSINFSPKPKPAVVQQHSLKNT